MKFTPKSQAELDKESAARAALPAGEYDFDVADAVDDVSKAGNDMITITLKVYDADSSYRKVKDWLLESVAYKLRHAAETCGLGHKYEDGEIEAGDFLGRSGRVKLKVEKSAGYPDKNVVADYVVEPSVKAQRRPASAMAHGDDDEIPF
ncbi:MAG TPA: hypothetical protein PLI96_07870 [Halothiobacillus sp.]|nr:hypothetical protein [Halothiobacillus sp.]